MTFLDLRGLVTATVLSVLIVVFQFAIAMGLMGFVFVSMIFSPGLVVFVTAPIFLVLAHRTGRTGAFFLFTFLCGLAYGLMGYLWLTAVFSAYGLVGELFMLPQGSYLKRWKNTVLWVAYAVLYSGTSLMPIWFFFEDYKAQSLAQGFSQEYIDAYWRYYTDPVWVAVVLGFAALMALAGTAFGYRLLHKHFRKAGLA